VQLGATTWPLLRRGGYPANEGGAVLAATGIGAILSPPTLGAAAFIIAEFLGISYFNVLVFATVPTFLYYLGIILAIEADARRLKASPVHPDTPPVGYLLRRFGYHFSSLGMIVLFLGLGLSPFRAVVYATVVAFLLSFLSRRDAMTPVRLGQALAEGGRAVVPVAVLCATAGIIVGVVGMTGMGFRLASMIVDVSGDSLALTALASAIAVVFLGLAVPVTASFIISAVIIAPALVAQGVPDYAAYMFVFYYSVLSEVSPPTAISPFAASALTGGDAMRTMWFTWRYSLPAFLVPFAFVLSPNGEGLLLQGPVLWIIISVLCSSVAVAALAVATGGWMLGRARVPERALCAVAGLMLLYLHPLWIGLGLGVFALAVAVHLLWRLTERTTASAVETSR
jgi:TRAP transporter 4TM/12TM fusion protein